MKVFIDFLFRSKLAIAFLVASGIWVSVTGERAPCWISNYYVEGWYLFLGLTVLGAVYSIWTMSRARSPQEYEEAGTLWFTVFAIFLAIWTAVLCSPG